MQIWRNKLTEDFSLRAAIHPEWRTALEYPDKLLELARLHYGPLHLIMPQLMRENLSVFKQSWPDSTLSVLFAHKSTKSPAFMRMAEHLGLGIDVASVEELVSALAAGFRGHRIQVTGVKPNELLLLASKHGCLISVDSEPELIRLTETLSRIKGVSARILLRLSSPPNLTRALALRDSKFGIDPQQLGAVFDHIRSHKELDLQGFHHHSEEQDPDNRAVLAEGLLRLLVDCYSQGFSPTILNIGGGFRQSNLANPAAWPAFVGELERALVENSRLPTWREHAFGMSLSRSGTIMGRERALGRVSSASIPAVLHAVGAARAPDGRDLRRFILENEFQLAVEPGAALLHHCGVSLVSVIETKHRSRDYPLVVLRANALNLTQRGRELLTDPLLIGPSSAQVGEAPVRAFLGGNLCRDSDVLSSRAVLLPRIPMEGDVLCFCNTAAYFSDFEDAQPHQHPLGKKYVLSISGEGPWVQSEESYYPELERTNDCK